jgi:hypothetical protein
VEPGGISGQEFVFMQDPRGLPIRELCFETRHARTFQPEIPFMRDPRGLSNRKFVFMQDPCELPNREFKFMHHPRGPSNLQWRCGRPGGGALKIGETCFQIAQKSFPAEAE